MDFTDDEIRGLVSLINQELETGRKSVVHPSTGRVVELHPILRKLLRQGVKQGALQLPPCFKGDN